MPATEVVARARRYVSAVAGWTADRHKTRLVNAWLLGWEGEPMPGSWHTNFARPLRTAYRNGALDREMADAGRGAREEEATDASR